MEQDINTDLCILQDHLDDMLDQVQHSNTLLKKSQLFEMQLLNLDSLVDVVDKVLEGAKAFFNVDIVTLHLVDEQSEIARFFSDDGYDYKNNIQLHLLKSTTDLFKDAFMGAYDSSSHLNNFPSLKSEPSSVAILSLNCRGQCMGVLNLASHDADVFKDEQLKPFIERITIIIGVCLENQLNFRRMRQSNLVDNLTGVSNRRAFDHHMDEALGKSQRHISLLSCLSLDIDEFALVNEQYGQQVGDSVLSAVAKMLKKQLRSDDALARYEGGKFTALLANISETTVANIAERMRLMIKKLSFSYKKEPFKVTISIGCVTYQPSQSPDINISKLGQQLIKAADSALCYAKDNGRDSVGIANIVLDVTEDDQKDASN